LEWLQVNNSKLSSLNLSELSTLTTLYVPYNQLTSLNSSNLPSTLTTLAAYNNQLTSLNVSGLSALTTLQVQSNQFTSLDISELSILRTLNCSNNLLTSLNVSNNTQLSSLNVVNNYLTSITGIEDTKVNLETFALCEQDGPTVYTVTFNANGGSVTPANAAVGSNGRLASLPIPTRQGYTFNGWFTLPIGGTEITTNYIFSANNTVYAQWTEETPSSSSGTTTPSSSSDGGTIIFSSQIAKANIRTYVTANSIVLENLPQNAKVELYNLQGQRIYSANPENPKILKIVVQTKGVYIVKTTFGSEKKMLRVVVR
jgi:uncharacterized repeat protein (TIGR02543 family)